MSMIYGCLNSIFKIENSKKVKALCKKKTKNQQEVIKYFVDEGCLSKTISDEEYMSMIREKLNGLNLKQKALDKIGLDEDEVSEIPPVMFKGFIYNNAYAKRRADGIWVSSTYQVSWVFFSSTQIYLYTYTFNMADDKKIEQTDEFFYKDVTSFSTTSETETAHKFIDEKFEVETNKFAMVVPGDKLYMSMDGVEDSDSIIQAMKQKLREKKM